MAMNPMMMYLMMSQMGGGTGGEGSGSENGMDAGALFKMMSGMEEENLVESTWEDAVVFGTARDRSGDATIGVLETRVVPPHADDPVARIRVKTNGVIFARPADLEKIGKAFMSMASEASGLTLAFEEAQTGEEQAAKDAQEKRSSTAMMGMLN